MPRIRTVKPEFFTSETMAACGPWARLLAIGLMQRADSYGRMKWVPRQILGDVFPWDEEVDLAPLAAELEACGFLVLYEVDGSKYAEIPRFREHQRLSGKEADMESKHPERPGEAAVKQEGSVRVFPVKHTESQEQGTGNREQGTGGAASATVADPSGPPQCPQAEIVALYHQCLPELTHHKTWDGTRADNLRARWRSDPKRQTLDYWRRFFEHVRESDFLMGRTNGTADRPPFAADLEWLVKASNFSKVIEGKYHNRGAA